MEPYIQISKINDFLYSPQSLYLHSVYEGFNQDMYHESEQAIGVLNHQNIEDGKYSSAKRYLQGTSVYSEKYNFGGKIDIFDTQIGDLVERKTKIKKVHEGHKFQLYAQMIALQEVGHQVNSLAIQSLDDNKRYQIPLPSKFDMMDFEYTINKMRHYDANKKDPWLYRCDLSIYRHLSY